MSPWGRQILGVVVCFVLAPVAGSANSFLTDFEQRTLFVSASADSGPQTSLQQNGDGSEGDFATLDLAVDAFAPTNGAAASSFGSQTSQISSALITASGRSFAELAVLEEGALASSLADVLLDLVFSVPVSVPFELTGILNAVAGIDGDALTFVDLVDITNDVTLFSFEALPGETIVIDESGVLLPDVSYQLLISSLAFVDSIAPVLGTESEATFEVSLQLVPEPSAAALLGIGLALLAARRARRSG